MTKVTLNPGVCGMATSIAVSNGSRGVVGLEIDTKCEMINKMGEALAEVQVREALKSHVDSIVYRKASEFRCHAACPVPMAVLKAIEAEIRMALPRPVSMNFEPKE